MIIILALIFYVCLFLYFYNRDKNFDRNVLFFLLLKVFFSQLFVIFYQYFEKGDLNYYLTLATDWQDLKFHELFVATDKLATEPSRFSLYFSRFFVMMYRISASNLYLMSFNFGLMTAVLWLEMYRVLKEENKWLSLTFLYAALLPSILFWTSGITKETLALPLFVSFLVFLRQFILKIPLSKLQFCILFLALPFLFLFRYFYLPFLFLTIWAYFAIKNRRNIFYWLGTLAFVLVYFLFQSLFLPHFQYSILFELIYTNYHLSIHHSELGNYMQIYYPNSSFGSLIWAYLQSFKGFVFFAFHSPTAVISSLENLFVLVLFLSVLYRFRLKRMEKEIVSGAIFVLLALGFFALVSPNYGSLSRYRVVYWFFIIWFSFYYIKSLPIAKKLIKS
jgi:hypothetical protein